jgi:predicted transcriptional regulator
MTKSRLIINITKLILEKYPARWSAQELSVALNANIRSVNRALAEMVQLGLIEKKYHSYSLPLGMMQALYGGKHYVNQEVSKAILLHKSKPNYKEAL